jgi:hypothetical protein
MTVLRATAGAVAGGDHGAADLVAERERQGVIGADAVVEVAQVGVAHAAARHLDGYFAGLGNRIERGADERRVGRRHHPAVGGQSHA